MAVAGRRPTWASLLLVVILGACGGGLGPLGGGAGGDPASGDLDLARLVPDDVVRGIVMTPAIDQRGRPTEPKVTFDATEPTVTAMVALGDVPEGSTLTVAWFRLDDLGRPHPLFSHDIPVSSHQRAYSIGVSQGLLAPGWYEVVASLGDSRLATLWRVADGAGEGEAVESLGQAAAGDGSSEAQPPSPGASGSYDWDDEDWWDDMPPEVREEWEDFLSREPYREPREVPPCHMDEVIVEFDSLELVDRVWASAFAPGCDDDELEGMTMVAAIVGPPTRIQGQVSGASVEARFDPCFHGISGESDMPGTEIHVVAWLPGGEAESRAGQTQIPDHPESFLLRVASRPASGSTVEPGDTITIRVLAQEIIFLGPGVRSIQVSTAEDVLADEVFDTPDCDIRRHLAALSSHVPAGFEDWTGRIRDEVTYTVPEDPPPVIVIQAVAEDAWGRRALGIGDLVFPTGDTWAVTIVSETLREYLDSSHNHPDTIQIAPGLCSDEWVTEFTFTAGSDGEFVADGTARLTDGPQCSSGMTAVMSQPGAAPGTEWSLWISGQVTDDAFEFQGHTVGIDGPWYAGYGVLWFEGSGSLRKIVIPREGEGPYRVEQTYTGNLKADQVPADVMTSVNTIEIRRVER